MGLGREDWVEHKQERDQPGRDSSLGLGWTTGMGGAGVSKQN